MTHEFWWSLNTNISDFNPWIYLHILGKNIDSFVTTVTTR
jgi:hypothetical protein